MAAPDISVIITAHKEGVLAGISAKSALSALKQTRAAGLSDEIIIILDRSDELTKATLKEAFGAGAKYLETDEGDPGAARNRGILMANGLCSTFLDADDLWSENWLIEAWLFIEKRPDVVAQSACNMLFGDRRFFFWHMDSEVKVFDQDYLRWMNYWDSLSFARTKIYKSYPFRRNNLKLGFGHEDWHWALFTSTAGIPHKPVPGTIHFKRAREGSQMAKVDAVGGVPWPLSL